MFPEKNNIKAHISVHATMQVNGNHRFAYFYVTVSMSSVAAIWISRTSTGFPHLSDENQRKPRSLCTATCTCRWLLSLAFACSALFSFVSFRFVKICSVVSQPLPTLLYYRTSFESKRFVLTLYFIATMDNPSFQSNREELDVHQRRGNMDSAISFSI